MDGLTPRQLCRISEQRVASVLDFLMQQELLRGYRKTRHCSKADLNGIDFYLFTQEKRIPLQVKSSNLAKATHDHYQYCKQIPCVVGRWQWNRLVDEITNIIERHGGLTHGDATG